MKGYLGGYIGARPSWNTASQSGIWTLQERLSPLSTAVVVVEVAGGATVTAQVELGDPCVIYSVAMDKQAWLRLYDKSESETADVDRTVELDPDPGTGVLLEVRTSGDEVIEMAPVPVAVNRTIGGSLVYPIRVTNETIEPDVTLTIVYANVLGVE